MKLKKTISLLIAPLLLVSLLLIIPVVAPPAAAELQNFDMYLGSGYTMSFDEHDGYSWTHSVTPASGLAITCNSVNGEAVFMFMPTSSGVYTVALSEICDSDPNAEPLNESSFTINASEYDSDDDTTTAADADDDDDDDDTSDADKDADDNTTQPGTTADSDDNTTTTAASDDDTTTQPGTTTDSDETTTTQDDADVTTTQSGGFEEIGQIIYISKIDGDTGEQLEGVVFEILDEDLNVIDTLTTSILGNALTELLDFGTYYVREKTALDGYILDETLYVRELPLSEEDCVLVVENFKDGNYKFETTTTSDDYDTTTQAEEEDPVGFILISKKDGNTKAPLKGVVFEILDADLNVIETVTTDILGMTSTSNLVYGDYYVREKVALEGYVLDETPFPFSIPENSGYTLDCRNFKGSVSTTNTPFTTTTNVTVGITPTKTGDAGVTAVVPFMVFGVAALVMAIKKPKRK